MSVDPRDDGWAGEVQHTHDILTTYGFVQPRNVYHKPDPRGREYGLFIVTLFNSECGEIHHTGDLWTLQWDDRNNLRAFLASQL